MSSPHSHRRGSTTPEREARDLRQMILNSRNQGSVESTNHQNSQHSSRSQSRGRHGGRSNSLDTYQGSRAEGSLTRKEEHNEPREHKKRSSSRDRSKDDSYRYVRRGRDDRRSISPRGRRKSGRSRSRQSDNSAHNNRGMDGGYQRGSGKYSVSRSRSRSKSYSRSKSPMQVSRRSRSISPRGGRFDRGKRIYPGHDSYRPSHKDQDRGEDFENRYNGRGDGRNLDRSQNGQEDNNGIDRYGYREGYRDHSQRDQNYRGGRRVQDMLPEFASSRREQRQSKNFSIWAPSPTDEELRNRSPSPDRDAKKKSSRSRSNRGDELESATDSDDSRSRRRRRGKHSKSSKHKRSSSSRHHKSSRKKSSRSSRRHSPTPSDSEDDDKVHRKTTKRTSLLPSPSSNDQKPATPLNNNMGSAQKSIDMEMEYPDDMWVEKKVDVPDDDMEVGPLPLQIHDSKINERSYGGALLAGEGSAMAAYVQDGKRIPRRGEIGLESDQIEQFENAGFVMSGSRHQRMNAVRVRKENQVISAEEKRALMIFNQEEKIKKDNKIINEMREMVASKLRTTGNSSSY